MIGRQLLRIPEDRFEARRVENCKVNSLSLVRFDRNDYSVPTQYAYRKVLAVGSLDRVRIVVDDHLIAEHVRDWGSENVHYESGALPGTLGAKAPFSRLWQAV